MKTMKTPAEIKKGLGIYLTNDEIDCESLCLDDEYVCPYKEMSMLTGKSCGEFILEDTLSLISQLEADNAKKDETIQVLQSGNDSLMRMIDEECEKTVTLELERDALLLIAKKHGGCEYCKHSRCCLPKDVPAPDDCGECPNTDCPCQTCVKDNDHWEWCGITEEENDGIV